MSVRTIAELKAISNTGDVLDEDFFIDLFDTMFAQIQGPQGEQGEQGIQGEQGQPGQDGSGGGGGGGGGFQTLTEAVSVTPDADSGHVMLMTYGAASSVIQSADNVSDGDYLTMVFKRTGSDDNNVPSFHGDYVFLDGAPDFTSIASGEYIALYFTAIDDGGQKFLEGSNVSITDLTDGVVEHLFTVPQTAPFATSTNVGEIDITLSANQKTTLTADTELSISGDASARLAKNGSVWELEVDPDGNVVTIPSAWERGELSFSQPADANQVFSVMVKLDSAGDPVFRGVV